MMRTTKILSMSRYTSDSYNIHKYFLIYYMTYIEYIHWDKKNAPYNQIANTNPIQNVSNNLALKMLCYNAWHKLRSCAFLITRRRWLILSHSYSFYFSRVIFIQTCSIGQCIAISLQSKKPWPDSSIIKYIV